MCSILCTARSPASPSAVQLTQELKPPFGAVRKLYRADNYKAVTDLAQLQTRAVYVAVGSEVLKKEKYELPPEPAEVIY